MSKSKQKPVPDDRQTERLTVSQDDSPGSRSAGKTSHQMQQALASAVDSRVEQITEAMITGGFEVGGEQVAGREIVRAMVTLPALRVLTAAEERTAPTRLSGDIDLHDPQRRRNIQRFVRALVESGASYTHYGRQRPVTRPRDALLWLLERIDDVVGGVPNGQEAS